MHTGSRQTRGEACQTRTPIPKKARTPTHTVAQPSRICLRLNAASLEHPSRTHEDPGPPRPSGGATHERNPIAQDTRECTGHRGRAEEEPDAILKLVAWIPKGQTCGIIVNTGLHHTPAHALVNDAWEQPRFCEPEADADADELGIPRTEEFGAANRTKRRNWRLRLDESHRHPREGKRLGWMIRGIRSSPYIMIPHNT